MQAMKSAMKTNVGTIASNEVWVGGGDNCLKTH